MRYSEPIAIRRDVEAIQIPHGIPMTLHAGTEVRITQALGDTYTVVTDEGYMARVSGVNADALGIDKADDGGDNTPQEDLTPDQVEERVWEALASCYDPEIPVNVVELGLIYSCVVEEIPETKGHRVRVIFTLTAPGCGMGPVLGNDMKQKILSIPTVEDADIQVTFEPAWDRSMMSEAARLQLGM